MFPSREFLGISPRYLLLLQIVQELHPVVGGEFPPARSLEYPDIVGLGRLPHHLLHHLEHEARVPCAIT